MQQAHSPGFERWAKLFNLKEMAKTLLYLQENGLEDYDVLARASDAAGARFDALYQKLPPKKAARFYQEHTGDLLSCQAAKRYFDSLGMKKLPSIQSLKQEYAALLAENKKSYPELKQARVKMIELMTAKNNVERILGMSGHSNDFKK